MFIGEVTFALLIFGLLLVARLPVFGMARWRWDLNFGRIDLPFGFLFYASGLVLILGYWWFCRRTFSFLIHQIKLTRLDELSRLRTRAMTKLLPKGTGIMLTSDADLNAAQNRFVCQPGRRSKKRRRKPTRPTTPIEEPSVMMTSDVDSARTARTTPSPAVPQPTEEPVDRNELERQSKNFEERRQAILAISEEPWMPGDTRRAQMALLLALAPPMLSLVLGPWGTVVSKAIGSVLNP